MKLKKLTQEQIDKLVELVTKLTNGEITEEEYIKQIKETNKTERLC
jgi:Ca2+-binding EF-hand superfamily protein